MPQTTDQLRPPASADAVPSISNILSAEDPITIIDIGAALVEDEAPCYQALLDSGNARLVAFEPDAAALQAMQAKYPPPNAFLPMFVGDGNPHTFFETSWGPTGSLFEPNTPLLEKFHNLAELTRVVATHAVDTVRLDDIGEITDADFLKIDAQGAEAMIFENGQRVLSGVTVIQTEVCWVELYKGMPLSSDIDRVLRRLGFQWHTCIGFGQRPFLPFLNPDHPGMAYKQDLWSDVVYVRDWMLFDRLPASKLIKMAVLLHDLYGSHDLAYQAFLAADKQGGTNFGENYAKWMTEDS